MYVRVSAPATVNNFDGEDNKPVSPLLNQPRPLQLQGLAPPPDRKYRLQNRKYRFETASTASNPKVT